MERPAYMHAFGMSGRHLILAEYPLRVNPLRLAFSGKPFIQNYEWRPEEGTSFQVIDRETGRLRGSYETDAFFCFHHVNAFERDEGRELVIDLIAYEDASIIDALYLDGTGPRGGLPPTELRRYVIDLAGGGVTLERLAEDARTAANRLRTAQHASVPLRLLRGSERRRLDRRAGQGRRDDGSRAVWRARLLSR